jgi:hypothetical protein
MLQKREGKKHVKKRQLLEFTIGKIHVVGKYNGKYLCQSISKYLFLIVHQSYDSTYPHPFGILFTFIC